MKTNLFIPLATVLAMELGAASVASASTNLIRKRKF